LGKRRITGSVCADDTCSGSYPSRESKPDPASKAQKIHACSRDGRHNLSVTQKQGATILLAAKIIMGVVAQDAFTATKNVHLKLGLESTKTMDLQVVVSIDREAGHIAKGKTDVARGFHMVKGATKGLILQKS